MTGARTPAIARSDRKSGHDRPEATGVAVRVFLVGILMAIAGPAHAQIAPVDGPQAPHVRPEPELRALVADAAHGSPMIRGLIDRLEELDVTVYIRFRAFMQTELEGRVALLSTRGGHRYLVIELACVRPRIAQMAALGHELYHAVEIADEPSIVDPRTLAAFYTRIGRRTDDAEGRQMFETAAAADAGARARRELIMNDTRRELPMNTTRRANGT